MSAKWGDITAGEIVSSINGGLVSGDIGAVFNGFSTDSRRINRGELFLALRGERFDGHDFVLHSLAPGSDGAIFSPGTRVDGSLFSSGCLEDEIWVFLPLVMK